MTRTLRQFLFVLVGALLISCSGNKNNGISSADIQGTVKPDYHTVTVRSNVNLYASPHVFCVELGVKMRRAVDALTGRDSEQMDASGINNLDKGTKVQVVGHQKVTCQISGYGTSKPSGPYPLTEVIVRQSATPTDFAHGYINTYNFEHT